MYVKCCLPNCDSKRDNVRLHKFPCDEVLRYKWLKCIGPCLMGKHSLDFEKLLVCHKHFEKRFHTAKSWLTRVSYPTLFSEKEIEDGTPSKSFAHIDCEFAIEIDKKHYDHNYCKPKVSRLTLLKDSKPLADNEDSCWEENHLDSECQSDDVTATEPREFSWQRPPEVIPCADNVDIQTDVSPIASDSAGRDGGDDRRPIVSHNERLHSDCKCNECGSEIIGYRYLCVQCCGVELCGACEASGAHPEHYVLRLPRPEPAGQLGGVLEMLRGLLDHLPLHDQVKKEEIDEEDPLSIGFVPPESASDKHNHFEFEDFMEEGSFEATTLPFENKFPLTDFTLAQEDTIRHLPADTVSIQAPAYERSPDIAHIDLEEYVTSSSVSQKHKKLSEVIPIFNEDSVVRYSVVRPCEEGMKTSGVRSDVVTSVGGVARRGDSARVRPPELGVNIGRLEQPNGLR